MPDEPQNNLSDFEIQLRSLRLPKSQLDRDALMYQAGKAAALASMSSGMTTTKQSAMTELEIAPTPRLHSQWQWKTATAALATVSCLLAGLLIQQNLVDDPGTDGSVSGLIASREIPYQNSAAQLDPANNGSVVSGLTKNQPATIEKNNDQLDAAVLAKNQPTFFQSLFGFMSSSNPKNISRQRIDQALKPLADRPKLASESTIEDSVPPKRTLIHASANHLLQEMFPHLK